MRTVHNLVTRLPRRAILLTIGVAALGFLATPSRAQFLINPSGGSNISGLFLAPNTASDPDDGSALRALGGTFTFYGTTITTIYAQADGFLSTTNGAINYTDHTVADLANVIGGSVIAPLYDDLVTSDTGNSVLEKIAAGSYYSLTYKVDGYFSDTSGTQYDNFQTVLFTGNTVVNGVSFLAGDIVFSYGTLGAPVKDSSFSVGVAQNATNATNPFGGSSQFATAAAFTSNFNRSTQGILFRPTTTNGVTTYSQTLTPLAVTPEPSQYTAFGLGVLGLSALALKVRRRSLLA